jgi:hypothetical protein
MIWDKNEVILGTWGTHCKHSAKHIVNNKIPRTLPPLPPLPQKKNKRGDKSEMLLETSWEVENMLGIHWEHNGNTL